MNIPLVAILCGLFTAILYFYVFYMEQEVWVGEEKTRLGYLHERKEVIYDNLRDLNFEYKAGKFPDTDYLSMKNSLEEEAATILAEIARLEEAARQASLLRPTKGARA